MPAPIVILDIHAALRLALQNIKLAEEREHNCSWILIENVNNGNVEIRPGC